MQKEEYKPLIDYGTVRRLQLRNPRASLTDYEFIIEGIEKDQLFPLITDSIARSEILVNILAIDHIIPSLYTFFEDTKWLEPCAKILRRLTPLNSRKKTIRQSLLAHHRGRRATDGKLPIQTTDSNFVFEEVTEHQHVEAGYRQLWLFAWRHFPELSAMLPRRDQGQAKPPAKAVNEQCWCQLGSLAKDLGFHSDNVTHLKDQNPDLDMTKAFLHRARPLEFFPQEEESRREVVERICQLLKSIGGSEINPSGRDTSFEAEVPISKRCGRPFERAYRSTRSHFFLPKIHEEPRSIVSHFNVNRDIYIAFFGLDFCHELSTRRHRKEKGAAGRTNPPPENQGEKYPSLPPGNSHANATASAVTPRTPEEENISQNLRSSDTQLVTLRNPEEEHMSQNLRSCDTQLVLHTAQGESIATPSPREGALTLTQVQSQRNQLIRLPDAGHSQLYKYWESCVVGHVCLVSLSDGSCKIFDTQEKDTIPPAEIVDLAKTSWFARISLTRNRWSYIDAGEILTIGKSEQHDGVVYHNIRHDGQRPTGLPPSQSRDSTGDRLDWVSKQVIRKKRGAPTAENSRLDVRPNKQTVSSAQSG